MYVYYYNRKEINIFLTYMYNQTFAILSYKYTSRNVFLKPLYVQKTFFIINW